MQSWSRTLTQVAQDLCCTAPAHHLWQWILLGLLNDTFFSHSWKSFFTCFHHQNCCPSDYLMCQRIFRHLFSVISIRNALNCKKKWYWYESKNVWKHRQTWIVFQILKFMGKKQTMEHVWFFPAFSTGSLHMVEGTILEDKKQIVKPQGGLFMPHRGINLRCIMAIT